MGLMSYVEPGEWCLGSWAVGVIVARRSVSIPESRFEASGEADKRALAEAAVTGQETVLPAPLPAEIKADAVDTDTWLNHCRMGASW